MWVSSLASREVIALEGDARRGSRAAAHFGDFTCSRRFLLTSAPPRSPRASPSPSAQILTHGLPARPDHEALDGRTCTLAAAILLLRRYTERHDFTARVYDNPPSGAAPTDPSSRFVATGCDCVDVRVSFDDDATVANVLVQCKRAIAEVGTTLTTTPDVLIATLRPGRDPEPCLLYTSDAADE